MTNFLSSFKDILFIPIRDNKNNVQDETEEFSVVHEVIQTLDVRLMIDQLLRSLRLKCNGLNKLPKNTFYWITVYTYDHRSEVLKY